MSTLISPNKPNLDIVLVHGLNVWSNPTHANDTWTSESSEGRVHWVRDFLPLHKETSCARVLVAEYNACAVFGAAVTGVVAQAEELLNWLWLERRGATSRPLIFIAHSLGGLIVKEALVKARNGSGKFASIWYFTTGIMFFGTPHRGTDTSMYGILSNVFATLSSNPNPGFLDSLEQYGEEAARLHQRFSTIHGYYHFVSVYETRPHRVTLGLIVPRLSAVLGLSDNRETRIALDRDHNQICKFSNEEEKGFREIVANLKIMSNKAILSSRNPTNFSLREQVFTGPDIHIDDNHLTIGQVVQQARSLLELTQTTDTVAEIDREITDHHSTTSSFATLILIPQAITLVSFLTFLIGLGSIFGGYLVPMIQRMIGGLVDGLEDVQTEQGHVLNLTRLNLQLLNDKLQATLAAKKNLEAQSTGNQMGQEQEIEAKDLLTRLDVQSEILVRELHRRRPSAEDAHRRVQVTEDFKEELRRAQTRQGESWLKSLISVVRELLTWLYNLVAEIGRCLAGLAHSIWSRM